MVGSFGVRTSVPVTNFQAHLPLSAAGNAIYVRRILGL